MLSLPGLEHHPHARTVLQAGLPPRGTPSHAYLLHGPAGTGKRTAARALAAQLLAEGAPDPEVVRARVARDAHPDLTWVVPSGAHELLVGDVDEAVIAAASHTPFEAARRVFVLEHVETMNEDAGNRLLKTLEEPPPHAYLLLLTDRLGEVLPTVVSRCQLARFDSLSEQEIARRLVERGADTETARACARLAMGNADRAERLATGDGPALRAEAEAVATAALQGRAGERPWRALLARAEALGDTAAGQLDAAHSEALELVPRKDRRRLENEHAERRRRVQRRERTAALELGLALIGLWLRDLACLGWDAADVVLNTDRLEILRAVGRGCDPQRLRSAVELVEETRQRLVLNVSEELALEALAYRLERRLAQA